MSGDAKVLVTYASTHIVFRQSTNNRFVVLFELLLRLSLCRRSRWHSATQHTSRLRNQASGPVAFVLSLTLPRAPATPVAGNLCCWSSDPSPTSSVSPRVRETCQFRSFPQLLHRLPPVRPVLSGQLSVCYRSSDLSPESSVFHRPQRTCPFRPFAPLFPSSSPVASAGPLWAGYLRRHHRSRDLSSRP